MKTLLLILITSVLSIGLYAQKRDIAITGNDLIYTSPVEVMPEYKGGMEKLYRRLENIRYLFFDRMQNIQGKVLVLLVIEKDGSVSNVQIAHGLTAEQDNEVVRVVKNLPRWKPGMQDGKPVRVQFALPIDFKLIKS
jgi:protein TonB